MYPRDLLVWFLEGFLRISNLKVGSLFEGYPRDLLETKKSELPRVEYLKVGSLEKGTLMTFRRLDGRE